MLSWRNMFCFVTSCVSGTATPYGFDQYLDMVFAVMMKLHVSDVGMRTVKATSRRSAICRSLSSF